MIKMTWVPASYPDISLEGQRSGNTYIKSISNKSLGQPPSNLPPLSPQATPPGYLRASPRLPQAKLPPWYGFPLISLLKAFLTARLDVFVLPSFAQLPITRKLQKLQHQ